MSNDNQALEKIIQHLTDKGVKIKEIYERLKVDRMEFYNTRRGTNLFKKRDFSKRITEAFPEFLTDGNVPKPQEMADLEKKYIEALERENELLRQLNQQEIKQILTEIQEIKKRLET